MDFVQNMLVTCDALQLLERIPTRIVNLGYLDPPWVTTADTHRNTNSVEEQARYLGKVAQQFFRVLNDTGSLVVHWSQRAPTDIRLLINQVFGHSPQYEITWRRNPLSSAINAPTVDSDFLLFYSKSPFPTHNIIYLPLPESKVKLYNHSDARGKFRCASLINNQARSSFCFDWQGFTPPPGKSWCYKRDKLDILASEDRIYFQPDKAPQLKRYLHEHPGVPCSTTWDDIPQLSPTERFSFPAQTPLRLMERIVQIASNDDGLILDPFCGSGTTIIAAQKSHRRWLCGDSNPEAIEITYERLTKSCNLVAYQDFLPYGQTDLDNHPPYHIEYRDIIINVVEIAKLQKDLNSLSKHLLTLKKLMGIDESDDKRIDGFIEEMSNWISESMAKQFSSVDNYIQTVCSWLTGWEKLDSTSQAFLPQAELLYENIELTDSKDYSPFIIQYCRALENELLIKLFSNYSFDFHTRVDKPETFLSKDFQNEKTAKFANLLKAKKNTYTLGDMNFILGLTKSGGKTLQESQLLQDFRRFTVKYFDEKIVEAKYLNQINKINTDFRIKSAHPYILDAETAKSCREMVRSCLNELILNYHGIE